MLTREPNLEPDTIPEPMPEPMPDRTEKAIFSKFFCPDGIGPNSSFCPMLKKIVLDNFFLRASIWDDTPAWQLEIIKRNNWPTYTAVDKFRTGDNFTRCRCKDCASCGKCWKNYQDIRCEIH